VLTEAILGLLLIFSIGANVLLVTRLVGVLTSERSQHREEITSVLSRKGDIIQTPVSYQQPEYRYVFDEEGLDYMVVPVNEPDEE